MLEALLLLPLIGSGLVFAFRNSNSKYLAVGIAFVQNVFNILYAISV